MLVIKLIHEEVFASESLMFSSDVSAANPTTGFTFVVVADMGHFDLINKTKILTFGPFSDSISLPVFPVGLDPHSLSLYA
jgi:hypothetical protein